MGGSAAGAKLRCPLRHNYIWTPAVVFLAALPLAAKPRFPPLLNLPGQLEPFKL
jgi:hypothetical protein